MNECLEESADHYYCTRGVHADPICEARNLEGEVVATWNRGEL